MKLWNVTVVVEVDVMVVAEDRAAAEKIATGREVRNDALRDALDGAYAGGIREVTAPQGIADGWGNALLFGPRSVEELTCAQWVERIATKGA